MAAAPATKRLAKECHDLETTGHGLDAALTDANKFLFGPSKCVKRSEVGGGAPRVLLAAAAERDPPHAAQGSHPTICPPYLSLRNSFFQPR